MFSGSTDRPPSKISRESYRRVARLFIPHRRMVYLTILAVIVGVLFGLMPPLFLRTIIDDGLTKLNMSTVITFSILTVLATIGGAVFTLLYGYWSVLVGQKIMHDMRTSLFDHLQGMSLKFFTSTRTGEIQTRLISDVSGVQGVVSATLTDALSNIGIIISTIVAMLIVDWRLTLLALALVPVFLSAGKALGEWARTIRKGTQEQTAELNSMMQEMLSVSGALLVKTSSRKDQLMAKFGQESEALAGWQIKQQVMTYVFFGLMRTVTALIPALVYWYAGYLMIQRGDTSLTVGKLVAFTMLQTRMFFPLSGMMASYVEVLSSFALFERIFEYMDLKQDITDKPNAQVVNQAACRGDVSFTDVWFKYEDSQEDWTLKGINIEAKAGELIALVGPSGSGKTTISYLIPRLYDAVKGSIKVDGVDVKDMTMASLVSVTGVVSQETYLVHDTVKENLRYANPDATDQVLIDACKAANIWDHISALPQGLDTVVGERGYKFSGGEKQRLAIARAILKNPKILILDEATSALDTTSERIIQQSMNTLMVGRTTFAIAHRLSTILHADQILVLRDGEIVERGKHDELLAMGGLYRELYEEQFQRDNEHVAALSE
ncbi:MAG: ABC transporter ATP-binding protein/permease [Armatimonadetes bacterium]|nr:ABC transporter ATP-binding protein/permease [Armatimonadota bacterium]